MPFGDELRRLRLLAGLTQEELAERAGLSVDAISALERGVRRSAQPRTVRALAAALKLSDAARMDFVASVPRHIDSGAGVTPRETVPVPPTPLVGREREQAAVLGLLDQPDVRLLTLTGPGGVGKTRLALAVVAVAAVRFDAVCFVDLATLHEPTYVPSIIAHSLGLHEQGGRDLFENLAAHIADRPLLLMLDNFEHLATAAPVVAALLTRCPRLKMLATSRAVLRVRSEYLFAVPPLAVPEEPATDTPALSISDLVEYPAVRLFIARAQAADSGFVLTPANAPAVAEICRRLDGLPLAIELAAARSHVLPPLALLSRLSNRLALLTEGPVDASARQRTLRAAIDWSYDLLNTAEKDLLRRLAVFVGGFTLEAAEAVGGGRSAATPSVLDVIESLSGKSLLRRVGGADAEISRFDMLETVREYGLERLTASGEEVTIRDAHAAYFLAMAERATMERIGPEQPLWLARLEADHSNLRAALAWLTERGEIAAALRLAASCSWYWWYRGHYAEGRARLQALLGQSDAATHGRAWAAAMTEYGLLTHSQGDSIYAVQLHEAAVAAWRRLAEPERLAEALYLYGIALMYTGDERAVPVSSEFLAIAQTLSDQQWLGIALWALGRARYYQGDRDGAAEVLNEALARVREVENPLATAYVLWTLGELAWDRGDEARALPLLRQAMARLWDLRETWSALLCLERLAVTSAHGHPQAAARLFAAAAAWRDAVGLRRPPVEKERYEQAVTVVRDVLGADAFAVVWAAGQSLTPEQAITEVLDVGRS